MAVRPKTSDVPTHGPTHGPKLRFSLASLMSLVTTVAIGCVVVMRLGPVWAGLLAFLVLTVGAHVFGNSLGTRLRAVGSQRAREPDERLPSERLTQAHFAPSTELRQRTSSGKATFVVTSLGSAAGGATGYYGFSWLYGDEITTVNLFVGAGAAALIGGFFAFAGASLVRVLWGAWRQAAAEIVVPRQRDEFRMAPSDGSPDMNTNQTLDH